MTGVQTCALPISEAGDLHRALTWVLIMVAISLAVITIIHIWDESQGISKNKDIKGKHLIRSLINFAIFSQFEDIKLQDIKLSEQANLSQEKFLKTGYILRNLPPQISLKRREALNIINYFFRKQNIIPVSSTSPSLPGKAIRESNQPDSYVNYRTLTKLSPPKSKLLENQSSNYPKKDSPKKELIVNIQKNLKTFELKVDFTADNHTLGLLGASGSGKSMTLRCIAGLAKPQTGCIILNGKTLFDAKRKINLPSRKRRIGFVFQNYALFPHMSVAQNIGFGLQNLPKQERIFKVQQYIDMMHLQNLENHYPHQLSGGQQQRVALARALVIEPEAILLDEPLSALDTYLRNRIEKLLRKVLSSYQGTTLFITHKLEEAYRVSNHILVMSQGKVIADDTKENIFERSPNLAVAQVTECKNISRAQIINSHQVKAIDWECNLQVIEPIPTYLQYLGIRAHHLTFSFDPNQENTFPCYVADISETQHRVTVYLKLNHPGGEIQVEDYDLQVEVYKEKWENIKDRPFPWYVHLNPSRLMLMES